MQTSGVDFVAPTIRGTLPAKPQYNGGGDTTKLADLVAAIKRRGAAIKISALDDTAASLTAKKNLDKHGTNTYDPKFDVGDSQGTGEGGYKYFWEYNLENWFKVVPADMRFTLSGRPVIYEWSLADSFFTDQGGGHAAAMLNYAKQHAQSEFGVAPYFIVDNSWIKEDPAAQDVVDGVNDWFSMTSSSTLATFKGDTFGVLVPGYHTGAATDLSRDIPAAHGDTLRTGLANTVGKGALVTLVEGFSDWKENCALWRGRPGTYDATRYDYPNQMINILRQYARDPFQTGVRIEAEGADSTSDTTAGNLYKTYRDGDTDIQATTDGGPGWNVGSTAAGEWLQWKALPMSGTVTLKVRVATVSANSQIRFDVDGKTGPVTTLPSTGAWTTYQTVNAGTFTFAANSVHDVRITFLNGGVNLNYWTD
ncbi:DUF5010 domain-containing protein [Actinoallomurus bryophytorum]